MSKEKKKNVVMTHIKCGSEMTFSSATKDECMGWYSATFSCQKCKVDVEIDEMGTEKVTRW